MAWTTGGLSPFVLDNGCCGFKAAQPAGRGQTSQAAGNWTSGLLQHTSHHLQTCRTECRINSQHQGGLACQEDALRRHERSEVQSYPMITLTRDRPTTAAALGTISFPSEEALPHIVSTSTLSCRPLLLLHSRGTGPHLTATPFGTLHSVINHLSLLELAVKSPHHLVTLLCRLLI